MLSTSSSSKFESIELLLNLARDKATIKRINEVTRLSEASITRYYTMLQKFGYGKMSKKSKRKKS